MELFKEYYKVSHISAMKWQSTKSLFAKLFIQEASFVTLISNQKQLSQEH